MSYAIQQKTAFGKLTRVPGNGAPTGGAGGGGEGGGGACRSIASELFSGTGPWPLTNGGGGDGGGGDGDGGGGDGGGGGCGGCGWPVDTASDRIRVNQFVNYHDETRT